MTRCTGAWRHALAGGTRACGVPVARVAPVHGKAPSPFSHRPGHAARPSNPLPRRPEGTKPLSRRHSVLTAHCTAAKPRLLEKACGTGCTRGISLSLEEGNPAICNDRDDAGRPYAERGQSEVGSDKHCMILLIRKV